MYDYLRYVFIGLRSLELPGDGRIMCPKHVGAVNSKYFATN